MRWVYRIISFPDRRGVRTGGIMGRKGKVVLLREFSSRSISSRALLKTLNRNTEIITRVEFAIRKDIGFKIVLTRNRKMLNEPLNEQTKVHENPSNPSVVSCLSSSSSSNPREN